MNDERAAARGYASLSPGDWLVVAQVLRDADGAPALDPALVDLFDFYDRVSFVFVRRGHGLLRMFWI